MPDHYNRYGRDDHHDRSNHGDRHRGNDDYSTYIEYAKKIFKNKTFLIIALLLLLFIVVIGIWLISLLIPLLGQLLSQVEKNGIKGGVEAISPYLLKLWEGAGK